MSISIIKESWLPSIDNTQTIKINELMQPRSFKELRVFPSFTIKSLESITVVM